MDRVNLQPLSLTVVAQEGVREASPVPRWCQGGQPGTTVVYSGALQWYPVVYRGPYSGTTGCTEGPTVVPRGVQWPYSG